MRAPWQERYKTGPSSPTFRFTVEGRDLSDAVLDGTVTYSASDTGASEMEVSLDRELGDITNRRVAVEIGYGDDLSPWFEGEAVEPYDDPWGEPSTAKALGPFAVLNDQGFRVQANYQGYTLGRAILDITRRASMPAGSVEIYGGSFALEGDVSSFPIGTTFGGALQTLLGSANFVGIDTPGFRRVYMRKPRPGATGRYKDSFDETDYEYGAFRARTTTRNLYSGVLVYRKGEDGSTAAARGGIEAFVPVEVKGPHRPRRNRIFQIPDFAGTQDEAWKEARMWARLLQTGCYECGLSGIDPRTDLRLYDNLFTQFTDLRYDGGRTPEEYAVDMDWQIDGQIVARLAEGCPMDVTGTGIKLRERKLPKRFYVSRGPSAVVRR